ncbi:MAG TPA: serine protease [Acidimicrobiales bacterium]
MPFYLQLATSIVLLVRDGDVSVGGTCFAFRERHNFLTAEHCVPEGTAVIVLQEPGRVQRPALAIERNPSHDVALIRTAPLETETATIQIVNSIPDDIIDGGDFITYGYPTDAGTGGLVGRLLKGHFQRYFGYRNSRGHTYFAGEMSIATPAGHSGGAVVRASSPQSL